MDFDKAARTSREGFADVLATARQMLTDSDPAGRADTDQCVTALRETFKVNGVPVNADTAMALVMGVALLCAELEHHHPNLQLEVLPCYDAHVDRVSIAAVAFHDLQDGHR